MNIKWKLICELQTLIHYVLSNEVIKMLHNFTTNNLQIFAMLAFLTTSCQAKMCLDSETLYSLISSHNSHIIDPRATTYCLRCKVRVLDS